MCRRLPQRLPQRLLSTDPGERPRHGLKLQPSQTRVSAFFPLDADNTFATDFPLSEVRRRRISMCTERLVPWFMTQARVSLDKTTSM